MGSSGPAHTMGDRRRISSDRSDIKQYDQTRNVRSSSMPGAPATKRSAEYPTTDEEFVKTYETAGIRSSLKNKQASPSPQSTVSVAPARREGGAYTTKRATTASRRRFGMRRKKTVVGSATSRVRATRVNMGILTWGIPGWLFFQLPFAIFSTAAFGVAGGLTAAQDFLEADPSDNALMRGLKETAAFSFDTLGTAANYVFENSSVGLFTNTFNIDVSSALNPATPFVATYLILMLYGMFMLMTMYLIYKLSGLNPLGGKGGGVKQGFLLLSLIGYAIPIANLLPWFLLWAGAVWLHPK